MSRLEIKICYLIWKIALSYRLLWQMLDQIIMRKYYETVDKLTSCYQIVELQAVAAVIPQKGDKMVRKNLETTRLAKHH